MIAFDEFLIAQEFVEPINSKQISVTDAYTYYWSYVEDKKIWGLEELADDECRALLIDWHPVLMQLVPYLELPRAKEVVRVIRKPYFKVKKMIHGRDYNPMIDNLFSAFELMDNFDNKKPTKKIVSEMIRLSESYFHGFQHDALDRIALVGENVIPFELAQEFFDSITYLGDLYSEQWVYHLKGRKDLKKLDLTKNREIVEDYSNRFIADVDELTNILLKIGTSESKALIKNYLKSPTNFGWRTDAFKMIDKNKDLYPLAADLYHEYEQELKLHINSDGSFRAYFGINHTKSTFLRPPPAKDIGLFIPFVNADGSVDGKEVFNNNLNLDYNDPHNEFNVLRVIAERLGIRKLFPLLHGREIVGRNNFALLRSPVMRAIYTTHQYFKPYGYAAPEKFSFPKPSLFQSCQE